MLRLFLAVIVGATILSACTHLAHDGTHIIDRDIILRGNDDYLKNANIDIRYHDYRLNGETFRIGVYQKLPITHTKYLVLHDSENIAYDVAIRSIQDGGRAVVLENQEKRHLFDNTHKKSLSIDPNRIFVADHPYLPLAMHILYLLDLSKDDTLIALHNNSATSQFDLYQVSRADNIDIACHNDSEIKNLYWLSVLDGTDNAIKINHLANNLCQYPINAVLEYAPTISTGDGSLSIYTANKAINYVNIETKSPNGLMNSDLKDTQADHAISEQSRYLGYLLSMLNAPP